MKQPVVRVPGCNRLHTESRDRGAALPLVLIFVFMIGLAALAVSSLTAVNVKYGTVVHARAHSNAAAEGALRDVVQRLADGGSVCPAADGATQDVATFKPRRAETTVTCTRIGATTPTGLHFEPPTPTTRYQLSVTARSGGLQTSMRAVVAQEQDSGKVAVDSWHACDKSGC